VSDVRAPRAIGRPTAEACAARDARLLRACRQVEGLFLSQLIAEMRRPTWGRGILPRSVGQQAFARRRDQTLAQEMGRRGALGLADMLLRELSGPAAAAQPDPRTDTTPEGVRD